MQLEMLKVRLEIAAKKVEDRLQRKIAKNRPHLTRSTQELLNLSNVRICVSSMLYQHPSMIEQTHFISEKVKACQRYNYYTMKRNLNFLLDRVLELV